MNEIIESASDNEDSPFYTEIDTSETRYENLIKTVQSGYHCNRGKARRIIKSILKKAAKKTNKQKKVN